ncbi:helix-turn-helix domain-containing protein [Streptococcus orisratti]|uniref:helix-turn-helix domain-containing protein n=1 Tax=Streptococcus orisratti TaxID=114652 RepID=UPI003D07CE3F
MINQFGEKVRYLREQREITREEFCGDETELSVRQLARIETGSLPNLSKAQFIASRLGVQLGELTDEKSLEPPKRYKELKYLILRTPLYAEPERIKTREEQLDEVSEVFYDTLPEYEQLVIDCLQAKLDIHMSNNISFGLGIIDDYFEQITKKNNYSLNDLVVIDIYFMSIISEIKKGESASLKDFNKLVNNLIEQRDNFNIETLFVLNNLLIHACGVYLEIASIEKIEMLIKICERIMSKIQDFQKSPILNMIEWKLSLQLLKDKKRAEACYSKALLFSNIMEDEYLETKLQEEWQKDCAT